jgi:hypothetical protein
MLLENPSYNQHNTVIFPSASAGMGFQCNKSTDLLVFEGSPNVANFLLLINQNSET